MQGSNFTVGKVARLYAVDPWKVRRVVDELNADLPRAGLYRLIPQSMLASIAVRLKERDWLTDTERSNDQRGAAP